MNVSVKFKIENCHISDLLQLISAVKWFFFVARPSTEAESQNCSFAASVSPQDLEEGKMTVGQ